ncbi:hypothetical protein HPB49_003327 [Dermacentor silvarum]|uniref:Uncharacterized protein n=1 Tax=Dermacentor silvarum TaxID=543639 RepID=A0ACB8CUV7_DERSI|nr:hypothetical protein HPB49_003327 [Dermacentor silvarum]
MIALQESGLGAALPNYTTFQQDPASCLLIHKAYTANLVDLDLQLEYSYVMISSKTGQLAFFKPCRRMTHIPSFAVHEAKAVDARKRTVRHQEASCQHGSMPTPEHSGRRGHRRSYQAPARMETVVKKGLVKKRNVHEWLKHLEHSPLYKYLKIRVDWSRLANVEDDGDVDDDEIEPAPEPIREATRTLWTPHFQVGYSIFLCYEHFCGSTTSPPRVHRCSQVHRLRAGYVARTRASSVSPIEFSAPSTSMDDLEETAEIGWRTTRLRQPSKLSVDSSPKSDYTQTLSSRSRSKTRPPVKMQVLKAGRMPLLPSNEIKIIIRPRGALNITKIGSPTVTTAVFPAAQLSPAVIQQDTVCPNTE